MTACNQIAHYGLAWKVLHSVINYWAVPPGSWLVFGCSTGFLVAGQGVLNIDRLRTPEWGARVRWPYLFMPLLHTSSICLLVLLHILRNWASFSMNLKLLKFLWKIFFSYCILAFFRFMCIDWIIYFCWELNAAGHGALYGLRSFRPSKLFDDRHARIAHAVTDFWVLLHISSLSQISWRVCSKHPGIIFYSSFMISCLSLKYNTITYAKNARQKTGPLYL